MDAFLRRVIEQREREEDERYRVTPLSKLPTNIRDTLEESRPIRGTRPREEVMRLFWERDEINCQAVVDELGFDPLNTNTLLSRMCREGLIARTAVGMYRRRRADGRAEVGT